MYRTALVTTFFIAFFGGGLVGQEPARCGDLPELPGGVDDYVPAFVDAEHQWLRDANGFETLSPGVEAFRVTDERACTPVWVNLRRRIREVLPKTPAGREARRNGFRFLVYRIGPYYVVPVNALDSEGGISEGYEIVNVFRADTHEFVGDYLS